MGLTSSFMRARSRRGTSAAHGDAGAAVHTTPLRLAQPPAVSTVHVAHEFTSHTHTPKGDLLFPETALLATTEDGLLFPETPRPELPLQRALREYGPYLPVIFLLWLASGAYFQWRFGVARRAAAAIASPRRGQRSGARTGSRRRDSRRRRRRRRRAAAVVAGRGARRFLEPRRQAQGCA